MCGIFAYLNNSGAPLLADSIQKSTDVMTHRGPNDYGYAYIGEDESITWHDELPKREFKRGIALGHRRLSILDLSLSGRQPFTNMDETIWMVFNGEIYNYIELRRELQSAGYKFRTDSDTEVLITAYEAWGSSCFNRLNGMWALVLWDDRNKKLVACRDRFGIKPLVYTAIGQDLVFASEAKAIFKLGKTNKAPNKESLVNYLSFFRSPMIGETFYQDILEIPAGNFMEIVDGQSAMYRYWNPPLEEENHASEETAIESFLDLFSDSVSLRLRSDVRVGTMLSGGLDSTSVIQKIVNKFSVGRSETKSIGDSLQGYHATFPNLPIFETDRVNDLAKLFDLNTFFVHPIDYPEPLALFHDCSYHMEGPFMNSVPMVNRQLMKCAKETGVTVVLNGHGADELFAGYPHLYHYTAASQLLRNLSISKAVRQIKGMRYNLDISLGQSVQRTLDITLPYRLMPWNWSSGSSPIEKKVILRPTSSANQKSRMMPSRTRLDQLLRRDFFHNVLPSWLNLEDRMSMAESVEARLPFLDYRIVEFAFQLPDSMKIRDGRTKYILRKAMKDRLPDSIVNEERKFYFSGPDAFFMQKNLKPIIKKYLFERSPYIADFVDCSILKNEFDVFWDGDESKTKFLWTAFATEYWVNHFT